jgi:DNA invertase Pin-like site-specific DNA recombinase
MTDAGFIQRRNGLVCDQILRVHQERLAIVYIRQSTVQQVERHQESTKLQYALADRAAQFGWMREQIVVIDDDLGRSGASIEGRLGFQRLVTEFGLGNVGLVLGVEMSRLALLPRLASALGNLRAVRHADRRRRRGVRSFQLQ